MTNNPSARSKAPAHHHLAVFLAVSVGLPCCSSGADGDHPTFRPGRLEYDSSVLQVSGLHTDLSAQARILDMPFGEAAERLGSLTFDSTAHLRFSRGNKEVDERSTGHIEQDAAGDFYVRQTTQSHSVEAYQVGDFMYVRQDTGKLRKKPRRQINTDVWPQRVHKGLREALGLFQPHIRLSPGESATAAGRSVIKYRLELIDNKQAGTTDSRRLAPLHSKSFTPHSRWRELGKPLQLEGYLSVDSQTGVVVAAEVAGRIEVKDRDIRPTGLTVSYTATVSAIGSTADLQVPESVPEMERHKPPREPLSFFADQLPEEPEPKK